MASMKNCAYYMNCSVTTDLTGGTVMCNYDVCIICIYIYIYYIYYIYAYLMNIFKIQL